LLVVLPYARRAVTGLSRSVNSHNHSMICIFLAPAGGTFTMIGLLLFVHSGSFLAESGMSTHCRNEVEIDVELACYFIRNKPSKMNIVLLSPDVETRQELLW